MAPCYIPYPFQPFSHSMPFPSRLRSLHWSTRRKNRRAASWKTPKHPGVAMCGHTCGHHITMGKASLIETVSKFGSQIQECKVLLLQQLICQNSCSEMRSYLLPSFAESDRDRSISRVATRAVCESPRKNGAKCPAGNMNMQFSKKITTNCNS
jgi:hypothetical protein